MEAGGVVSIFTRSKVVHLLQYTKYLGDGDSKAFKCVVDADVYGGTEIEKIECTGHIQKRMGKALMNAVEDSKGKVFIINKDGKKLSKTFANQSRAEKRVSGIAGAGKLTKNQIKRIQGHYGAAVRSHDNISDMRKAIWDIFHHRRGDHSECPSWCASHDQDLEKANKHKLPPYICDIIKPVFERLSSDDLLSKCTHGGTQNAKEAFHHIIWQRVPKEKFCGTQRLKLGVDMATLSFNDGERGVAATFGALGLPITSNQWQYAVQFDANRVKNANRAVTEGKKSQRQKKSIDKGAYNGGAF